MFAVQVKKDLIPPLSF